MIFEPYYYQQYAIDFILNTPNAGLFLDLGMGKTVIILSAIEKLMYDYFDVSRVLVIAPLAVAKNVWGQEIKKWEHLKNLTYSLAIGTKKERDEALKAKADIYIINRENVPDLVKDFGHKWVWDFVVIDELSSFKSSKAQRFRELRKVRRYIKRIVGLTGTPAPNGLLDLWPQIYLLDEELSLGRTITGYREKYFLPDKRNATTIFSWKLKDGAEIEIYDKISNCCISMKSAEYLQLPEKLSVSHSVNLPETVKEKYKQLERDMLLPYADGDVDAGTAGILVNKLLQLCGGSVYDENGGVKNFHDEKLIKLEQLIEEANGQPVIVFYAYKHERERILAKFPEAVDVKSENAVERWNAGTPVRFRFYWRIPRAPGTD